MSEALLRACVATLRDLGAEVRCFAEAENLVRRRRSDEGDGPPFVVEVEGLPNLLHELLHVLQLGEVRVDHGTAVHQIPFEIRSEGGRRLWFEELACCTVSARWHPGSREAALDWFVEQVGIQHHFFGLPDPGTFLERAEALEREHSAERALVEGRAELALLDRLGPIPARGPRHDLPFAELWATLRRVVPG